MLLIIQVFSALVLGMGLVGLIVPRSLVKFGRAFADGPGVWGGLVMRALLAGAFWFAAPAASEPDLFRGLAVLFGIGAIALPVIGNERLGRIVGRGAGLKNGVLRAVSLFVTVGGGLLLWAATAG